MNKKSWDRIQRFENRFDLSWLFKPHLYLDPHKPKPWTRHEDGMLYFDSDKYHANADEYQRWLGLKDTAGGKLFGWMRKVPVIGNVMFVYWYSTLNDTTALPLDALAFSFLNDWDRPTLWHSVIQATRDMGDPLYDQYGGIWPGGAPHNRAEADEMRAKYEIERFNNENGFLESSSL